MKNFWLMTHSATAALGWVAIAQASGQAMDEAPTEPSSDLYADASVVAVEPVEPAQFNATPPAPAPAPQPAWTAPAPQPQTSYVDPSPVYTPEPAALPAPEPAWTAPSPSPAPPSPTYIEDDPVLQAVINPETPAEAAAVEQLRPEEIIRDNRSFSELIAPPAQTQTSPPPQVIPPSRPAAPPVATVTPARTVDSSALLEQLELDLAQIRREIRSGFSATSFSSSLPDLQLEGFETQLTLPTPGATAEIEPLDLGVWDVAGLGATFTRNDFNVYTFSATFFGEDLFAADWESLGLDAFDSELLAQLDVSEWAIDFEDLRTNTEGLLADLDLPLDSEALPMTSFDASGNLALDFSALDAVAEQSPLGVNPLTFGYQADELTESVVSVVQ
ncbi:MAG: hypothetical protein ACPGVO_03490 [Spirulinaceae cyanobacterium]